MDATDLAAVIVAVVSLATMGALVWLVADLRRTTAALRATVARLEADTAPAAARLAEQVAEIDAELRRVDGLLERADKVSARADTLSKVTYQAVAKPVINTAAAMKGTSRAAQRLRRKG